MQPGKVSRNADSSPSCASLIASSTRWGLGPSAPMLRHFCLQNFVHVLLHKHFASLVAEQNFAEGVLVKRYFNWVTVAVRLIRLC
jgi:hypothetical protein